MDTAVTQKIKELIAKNKSREEIRSALRDLGVTTEDADSLLDLFVPASPRPLKPNSMVPPPPTRPIAPADPRIGESGVEAEYAAATRSAKKRARVIALGLILLLLVAGWFVGDWFSHSPLSDTVSKTLGR